MLTKIPNISILLTTLVLSVVRALGCDIVNSAIFNLPQKSQENEEVNICADSEIKAYANYCVAINLILENRLKDAVKYLTRTVELDPYSEKAHLYLSSCYFQLKKNELAIVHLEEAARIDPDDFNIHYTLGSIFRSSGEVDMAINEFELAIGCKYVNDHQMLYGDALFSLADLYVKKSDIDKAISCLNAIVDLNIADDPSKLYFEIGRLYYNNGDIKNAIDTFEIVKDLNPLIHDVTVYLANCYERLDRLEDAVYEIKTLLSKSPNVWKMHLALYRIYNKMEDEDLANSHLEKTVNILNKSISIGSKDPDEYITLGQVLLNQNDEKRVLTILNKCLLFCQNEIKKRDIHFLLSNAYYELNEFDNAENELKKTLEIDDNLHQANNFLGYFYAERGYNLDEAIVLIKKALDAEPKNAAYIDSLGWAYFKKAVLDDNKDMIQLALEKLLEAAAISKDPEIQEHIGDVYYNLEKWNKAEEEWTKALDYSNNVTGRHNDRISERLNGKLEKLKKSLR